MSAPTQPLPASLADLTPEWLTATLRTSGDMAPDAEVTALSYDEISAGVGFIGIVARLKLDYSPAGAGPATLIAKVASADPGARMLGAAFGLYEREVRFYSELSATCGVPAPRSPFAAYEPMTGGVLILLEDLTEGAFGDQIQGCTIAEAEMGVATLARMHARWWQNPELDRFEWLKSGIEIMRQPAALMYEASWPVAVERYGHLLPQTWIDLAPTLLPRAMKALDQLAALPETLGHGDFRHDNLFFSTNPERPLIVCDWQGTSRATGAIDFAYFVAGSLPVEDRRAHEDDLMRRYHALLQEGGVRDYTLDHLRSHYRQVFGGAAAAAGMVGLANIPESNERGRLLLETITARYMAASEDLDSMSLLPE
jgi:hypothetical protein